MVRLPPFDEHRINMVIFALFRNDAQGGMFFAMTVGLVCPASEVGDFSFQWFFIVRVRP
jgi:hypothetical protein